MQFNILNECNRHGELLQASSQAVSDSLRDDITREVLAIEGRIATAKPRTEDERRAMLGVIAAALEADGGQPEYIAAIRATL